ncbi:MAG: DUF3786 domain-containing protein [Oscillospiraceae bacterium]|nr:DUF3786 domain-containing protein [Oscillospiraceae bacterium]
MASDQKTVENNKEEVPFRHYCALFQALDPAEAAARCGVAFDGGEFCVRLLDAEYFLAWPDFAIRTASGEGLALGKLPFQTFLMRYLLEGKAAAPCESYKTFREMPWGEVYLTPFTGRCLTRAAFTFGPRLEAFRRAAERLGGTSCLHGDASYRFELLGGYRMELIVWAGDEEFPPSSQILYTETFAEGFSAEDRVVAGDILITAIKEKF